VPFRWADAAVLDGEVDPAWVRPAPGRAAQSAVDGVPANGQVFLVPAPAELTLDPAVSRPTGRP
jgi:hypothetical protein